MIAATREYTSAGAWVMIALLVLLAGTGLYVLFRELDFGDALLVMAGCSAAFGLSRIGREFLLEPDTSVEFDLPADVDRDADLTVHVDGRTFKITRGS